jgi:hypothetical protein
MVEERAAFLQVTGRRPELKKGVFQFHVEAACKKIDEFLNG